MKKLISLLLAAAMMLGTVSALAEAAGDTPLVVTTSALSSKFSPFFADTAYDRDAEQLTQIQMAVNDRTGGLIYNAIEGETHAYNGTDYLYTGPGDLSVNYDKDTDITTYGYKLKQGIKFSDGVDMTIDDVIFNYYMYLDPAYVGSTTLSSYDILGLQAYRTQIPEASLGAVNDVVAAIKAAGFGYTVKDGDAFTQEVYDKYYGALKELWRTDLQTTVDTVFDSYAEKYAEKTMGDGKTKDVIGASDGLKVAFGAAMWNFGQYDPTTGKLTFNNGTEVEGEKATIDDLYAAVFDQYKGDVAGYLSVESAVKATTEAADKALMTDVAAAQGVDMSAGVPNIEGIKRIDDYSLEVKVKGFSAPAVYSILGLEIAPMHYYGDPAQYDYANNKFGHPFGDLSIALSKTDAPMGAGPYKFIKYENRVVYYEANEYYYKGAPKTKYLQLKETQANEVATAVQTGTADGGEMSGNKANFAMLRGFNSNGELVGDVVTTYPTAFLGYGYIGINADAVKVGEDPGSEASKNLRKALATVLAVYRDTAFDSYYGDAATVINYPISSTSWAAPQATDEGYRVAYSVDVDGNALYTADMTADQRYDAAIKAAIGYLKAAGYTFDEASGKFTAAPEGASLSYEAIVPADGKGDHPSFAVVTDAHNALATIGIDLKINDPADSNVLWSKIDAGTQQLWCAAWSATLDPDMYQTYHSSNIVGLPGSSESNHYHIQSAKLDELIMEARKSPDQSYRKELYKAALDEIMDWAVEIPAYQRQDIKIASSQRIDTSTVTPDVTTYWGWLTEVEMMMLNANK